MVTPISKQLRKILINIRDQSSWIAACTRHGMQVEESFEMKDLTTVLVLVLLI